MKILVILLSSLLLTFTTYATNCHKEGGHSHDEVTTNGLSSGEITDNFININVNGMVCDFCARGIEKTLKKNNSVRKVNIDLAQGKVLIAYDKKTNIDVEQIKKSILANGQNVTDVKVISINTEM